MNFQCIKFQYSVNPSNVGRACVLGLLFWGIPVGAADQPIPWECTGFAGEAQIRCTRTFTELQQEKIMKLERALEVQQQRIQLFQHQIAQQASTTAKLERKLSRKQSRWYYHPSLQIYPLYGLNYRWGRDRIFGGSLFFGRSRYYSPRFFGHGHRRSHRH